MKNLAITIDDLWKLPYGVILNKKYIYFYRDKYGEYFFYNISEGEIVTDNELDSVESIVFIGIDQTLGYLEEAYKRFYLKEMVIEDNYDMLDKILKNIEYINKLKRGIDGRKG